MSLTPLHDRIVIKRNEKETTSAGGILLPGAAAKKPAQGIVVSVGSGKIFEDGTKRAPEVAPGDRVLFGQAAGVEVEADGETYLVMYEAEIIGIIR